MSTGTFRDLNTYRAARETAARVADVSRTFPRDERYSLTDQIRRSSRAVAAILAEAWARRRYRAAFISKLTEAQGEAMETQAWLDMALDARYITPDQHHSLDAEWQRIGGMLTNMIKRADDFCKLPPDHTHLKEDTAPYEAEPANSPISSEFAS